MGTIKCADCGTVVTGAADVDYFRVYDFKGALKGSTDFYCANCA